MTFRLFTPFHAYRYYLLGPCWAMADLREKHFSRSSFNHWPEIFHTHSRWQGAQTV